MSTANPSKLAGFDVVGAYEQDQINGFSSELLDCGTQLDMGQQAIVFVDIIQSSHWFATEGDANAFSALLDFFEELAAIADRHGGALVKGLGDGGMLAFAEPSGALDASIELQRAMSGSKPRVRVSGHSHSLRQ